ncbi:hypothetical protein D3C71_1137270 [compost metagenome]
MPAVQRALGDDVDHATHGVGAVQGGGRATDHFDAFDRIQRWDVVELIAAEVIRVDVAMVVLATAVDQDQRVIRAHAAHRNGALAGLVAGFAHVHAFQVTHRVEQGHVRALGQLFLGDDRNARRRIGDLLLKAAGGDDHLVQRGRGAVAIGVGGDAEGAEHGGGEQVAGDGRATTMALGHGGNLGEK